MVCFRKTVVAATLAIACALPAQAGLIGDTVGTRYFGSGGGDTGVQLSLVGAGEEGNFFGSQIYDYGDASFAIRSTVAAGGILSFPAVSLELSSLDFGVPITGVTFQTNLSGVGLSFTDNSITFTWVEQSILVGTYLTAQINAAVPEPETYALMAVGLAFVTAALRRRRQRPA